jgi:hypothetical protein
MQRASKITFKPGTPKKTPLILSTLQNLLQRMKFFNASSDAADVIRFLYTPSSVLRLIEDSEQLSLNALNNFVIPTPEMSLEPRDKLTRLQLF